MSNSIMKEKRITIQNIEQKGEEVNVYHFLSYIKSIQSDKAISYVMSVKETNTRENEKLKLEELEEKYLKIIKSIHFTE